MPRINGKEVVFHTRFPAKDNWDLPGELQKLGTQAQGGVVDMQSAVPLLTRVVKSWEFDGDPTDADAYGNLDIFREFVPLVTAVAQYVAGMTGVGEAGSGPT